MDNNNERSRLVHFPPSSLSIKIRKREENTTEKNTTSFFSSIGNIDSSIFTNCIQNTRDMISNINIHKWNKEQWFLVLSIIILIISTSTERVTFKMTVDRMIPFRFVLIESIFLISLILYGIISFIKETFTTKITLQMKSFSHIKLLKMAILDTIQFAGLFSSASGVSPTMTVILLHASTPCIVLGSRVTFPNRKYSSIQIKGVQLMSIAILISISRPIINSIYDKSYYSSLSSTLLYVFSAAFQGIATLYKEKCIIDWSQPMDIHYLSSWLFIYQFLVALLLAPLLYVLQGISNDWKGYPLSSIFHNIYDGWQCLGGDNPYDVEPYDPEYTYCENSIWLIVGFVVSNILVLECIGRVLQTSNQILGRSMAAAIFVAFIALGVYDVQSNEPAYGYFNSNIGIADMLSIIFLLAGMEVFGRDDEPEEIFVTNYEGVSTANIT